MQGFERVVQGLRVRGCWRPNRNFSILTPHFYGRHVVSFLFSWCSTGGLGAHSARWSATSYQQLLRSPNSIGVSEGPLGWVWLSLPPSHLQLAWNSNSIQLARRTQLFATATGTWTQLSYIIVRRQLDLWNRMFNHHQAEITVIQFTGHSLPVHQSMSVPWEFFSSSHFISQFSPTRFPLITAIRMCHLLPMHHLGMAFLAGSKGQNTTITNTVATDLKIICKNKRIRTRLDIIKTHQPALCSWMQADTRTRNHLST